MTTSHFQGLLSLPKLVAADELVKIQKIIEREKVERSASSHVGGSLAIATRDAFILKKYEIASYLIQHAVTANDYALDDTGWSWGLPFVYYAVNTNELRYVKMLQDHGLNLKEADPYGAVSGEIALSSAIEKGYVDIATYLIDQGVDCIEGVVREEIEISATFIALAAYHHQHKIIDLLVQHGAAKELAEVIFRQKQKYRNFLTTNYMRRKTEAEREEIVAKHQKAFQILMDCAVGYNFSTDLNFLMGLDVTGFNFVGVSVNGFPVTQNSLRSLTNADKAIVTVSQLASLTDKARRIRIFKRINEHIKIKGEFNCEGILNLVSIPCAVRNGDIATLKFRLAAGGDPNETEILLGIKIPVIMFAIKDNHGMVVDTLVDSPKFDHNVLYEAILKAADFGRVEIAQKLINKMQNVNETDFHRNTLLHQMASRGEVTLLEALIKKNAKVNLQNYYSASPLHLAAYRSYDSSKHQSRKNHILIIQTLLRHDANPNLENNDFDTPLEVAAKAGSAKAVELLLPPVTRKKLQSKDILRDISCHKDKEILCKMTVSIPWYCYLPFYATDSAEWLEILKLLKKLHVNLSIINDNMTLLHISLKKIIHIAETQNRSTSNTLETLKLTRVPLMKIIQEVDFLLAQEFMASLTTSWKKNTALHDYFSLLNCFNLSLIEGGHAKLLDKFLKNRWFDINAKNADGQTLLHLAACFGNISGVRYLIASGADVNAQDNFGNTPLHFALSRSYDSHPNPLIVAALIQAHANPDLTNHDGLTPCTESMIAQKNSNYPGSIDYASISESFELARQNLSFIKHSRGKLLSEAVQVYRQSPSTHKIVYALPNNMEVVDELLLDWYRDPVTQELYHTPVKLNERIYDIDTLLDPSYKQCDPVTGLPFELSEIAPAETVLKELTSVMSYLQNKYSACHFFSIGRTGFFGKNTKATVEQIISTKLTRTMD